MNTQLQLIITYFIVLAILFFLSAFFSSADMAFGSVSKTRIDSYLLTHTKSRKAKNAKKFIEKYDFTIAIILFLNDVANIAIETISALLGYALFQFNNLNNPSLGSFLGTLISIIVLIIFGEILPKLISKKFAFKLTLFYSSFFNILYYPFYPIAFLVTKFSGVLMKKFGKKKNKIEVTDEELEEMVDAIEKEGVVDKENADILRGTIDYASTEAYEIMTPRVDVYAIDVEDSIDSVLSDDRAYVHSRIPVYRDTIDNIIGFVRIKDLIRLKLNKKNVSINSVIKEILRFPRSTEINDILQIFKKTKIHFALVLDEYGGVEGIVTMEDILEEIVGEIWDEVDDVNEPFTKISNSTYIVEGSMNLNDFFDQFDIDSEDISTEYVSIGGYCIELLNDRFAKKGDTIYFKNIVIKVLDVDETNTIKQIKVRKRKS
jgi:Hemolysins and related proteins containing CBS domains